MAHTDMTLLSIVFYHVYIKNDGWKRILGLESRWGTYEMWSVNATCATGWRRLIGSPKVQIIFHKRATKYRALLRKMTYKDKGSYESSPPCMRNTSWDLTCTAVGPSLFLSFSIRRYEECTRQESPYPFCYIRDRSPRTLFVLDETGVPVPFLF